MSILNLVERLEGVRKISPKIGKTTQAWRAHCPCHQASPGHHGRTLEVAESVNNGVPLIWCHAACDPLDVLHAVGLEWGDVMQAGDLRQLHGKSNGGPSAWVSAIGAAEAAEAELRKLLAGMAGDLRGGCVKHIEAFLRAGDAIEVFKKVARQTLREESSRKQKQGA